MSSEIKSFEHKAVGYGEHLLKDHFEDSKLIQMATVKCGENSKQKSNQIVG